MLAETIKCSDPVACLLDAIPVLKWLPTYDIKHYLFSDIISGITVFIMQIPQGMAFGFLAHVSPVFGLYMAFYQVLIYFVFGTSRHISMGTFAVTCLMTGKVVAQWTNVETMPNGTTKVVKPELVRHIGEITSTDVGVTLTFIAVANQQIISGGCQVIVAIVMYFLRLGAISTLLSDTMVSGFTCAAAFHVAASQLKDLLGLNIAPSPGNFSVLYTVYNAALDLPHANKTAIIISAMCIIVQVLNNELLKPWLAKRCKIPFPIEIMVVFVTIAVTYISGIHKSHAVTVVGSIPKGLATISIPAFNLIPSIWLDALVISLVAYATALSMALIFARKLRYEIDATQELLAHGMTNLISAFFCCVPTAASLSRCVVQEAVGGITQVASVISSILILIVLLWLGPLFELLPRCVLASIILVALQGLLLQVRELPLYWHLSHWDGFVWAVTFFTTLIVQISFGLAMGIAASVFSLAMQSVTLEAYLMGRLPGTDIYLAKDHYEAVEDVAGIKIIHFIGCVSFASKNSFRNSVVHRLGYDPVSLLRKRQKLIAKGLEIKEEEGVLDSQVIIFDFSSLTFLDPTGVEALRHIQNDFVNLEITLLITESSGRAHKTILQCDKWEHKDSKIKTFPTVHDAVLYAQANYINIKNRAQP